MTKPGTSPVASLFLAVTVVLTSPAFARSAAEEDGCRFENHVFKGQKRTIYLNFVPHRSLEQLRMMNALVEHPRIITKDLLKRLKQFVDKIEPAMHLADQAKDAARLLALVDHGQVSWIGVEFSPSQLSLRDDQGLSSEDYFRKLELNLSANGADRTLIDRLLLLYAGSPASYVWFKSEKARRELSLVALDSDELKARGQELLDNDKVWREVIAGNAKREPGSAAEVKRLLEKMRVVDGSPEDLSDDQIESFKDSITTAPRLRGIAGAALRNQREFYKNQRARDVKAIDILSAKSGNGWISEGSWHSHLPEQMVARCKLNLPVETPDPATGDAAQ